MDCSPFGSRTICRICRKPVYTGKNICLPCQKKQRSLKHSPRSLRTSKENLSNEEVALIMKRYAQLWTIKDIAKELGVSRTAVSYTIKKMKKEKGNEIQRD